MAWTEETKSQSHWKELDITDRDISRKDIEDKGTMTRDEITTFTLFPNNFNENDVMRVDIENAYGNKATPGFTEETKGNSTWIEESKS